MVSEVRAQLHHICPGCGNEHRTCTVFLVEQVVHHELEIQELFALLDLVKVLIPEETLDAPVMDLIGDLIPSQFASIAAILLKGKTLGAILDQLSQELNAIPIEIGIYLYKDKNIN